MGRMMPKVYIFKNDIHDKITDRICELENFIESFSEEVTESEKELIEEAYDAIDELEKARNAIDDYL